MNSKMSSSKGADSKSARQQKSDNSKKNQKGNKGGLQNNILVMGGGDRDSSLKKAIFRKAQEQSSLKKIELNTSKDSIQSNSNLSTFRNSFQGEAESRRNEQVMGVQRGRQLESNGVPQRSQSQQEGQFRACKYDLNPLILMQFKKQSPLPVGETQRTQISSGTAAKQAIEYLMKRW